MTQVLLRTPVIAFVCALVTCAIAQPKTKATICLDPGHPSEVGRGTSSKSISEIAAAWKVSKKLEAMLKAKGYRVVLTKNSENQHVTNKRRAEIANAAKADLLLRLHCDAAREAGFATFYPAKQGTADGFKGLSPAVIKMSKQSATPFHKAVMKVLAGSLNDRGVRTDAQTSVGAKHGGALIGSIYSKVPVLLVEMCVLNKAHDQRFIRTDAGQKKMAEALFAGIQAALAARKIGD